MIIQHILRSIQNEDVVRGNGGISRVCQEGFQAEDIFAVCVWAGFNVFTVSDPVGILGSCLRGGLRPEGLREKQSRQY